ncbi:MAG TPA: hypothetical protein VFF52_02500 [Isosphaeraceae bacterium]|nr:hypothetical protein [Isosphaeraceae bacterium]
MIPSERQGAGAAVERIDRMPLHPHTRLLRSFLIGFAVAALASWAGFVFFHIPRAPVWISFALAAIIGLALIPRRTLDLLLFTLAITAGIYLINPHLVTYSYHGLIHLGDAYACQRLTWPPEDPYFAGRPLYYPWAFHALAAGIASRLNLPPSWMFAVFNLAALAVTVVVLARLARRIEGDTATAHCAVILGLLAPTCLSGGGIDVLDGLTQGRLTELADRLAGRYGVAFWSPWALPPLMRYSNVTAMPAGMALGLVCFAISIRSIQENKIKLHYFIIITTFISFVGYIYPFMWLSTCVMVAACLATAAWAGNRRGAGGLAAALLLGNLPVAPYLRGLTSGRGQGIAVSGDPGLWLAHLLHAVIILSPVWLLIALRHRSLVERLRARSWVHWAALGSGLALLLTFILLRVPGEAGYKFRAMAVLCLAPLAAPGLKQIYDRNRTAVVLLLTLLFLPLAWDFYGKLPRKFGGVTEPYSWQGAVLRHAVPSEDRLYRWIRDQTPPEAILIDREPYVPVFANRSLFVALLAPRAAADPSLHDGWNVPPRTWLELYHGHPAEEIQRRYQLVDALYDQAEGGSGADLFHQLVEATAGRPVFLIARNGPEKAALDHKSFLQKVAAEGDWAVYRAETAGMPSIREQLPETLPVPQ